MSYVSRHNSVKPKIVIVIFKKKTGDLENQFSILREQLFQERMKQNDLQLNEVRSGRSQEYLEPLKQLTDHMQNRIEVAGVLKRLRLDNANHKFLCEEQAAKQHYEVKHTKLIN